MVPGSFRGAPAGKLGPGALMRGLLLGLPTARAPVLDEPPAPLLRAMARSSWLPSKLRQSTHLQLGLQRMAACARSSARRCHEIPARAHAGFPPPFPPPSPRRMRLHAGWAHLEALAVLLEAAGLLAMAALVVAALAPPVLHAGTVRNLGSEGRRVALERRLDSHATNVIVHAIVAAAMAVAALAVPVGSNAKEPQGGCRRASTPLCAVAGRGAGATHTPDAKHSQ